MQEERISFFFIHHHIISTSSPIHTLSNLFLSIHQDFINHPYLNSKSITPFPNNLLSTSSNSPALQIRHTNHARGHHPRPRLHGLPLHPHHRLAQPVSIRPESPLSPGHRKPVWSSSGSGQFAQSSGNSYQYIQLITGHADGTSVIKGRNESHYFGFARYSECPKGSRMLDGWFGGAVVVYGSGKFVVYCGR